MKKVPSVYQLITSCPYLSPVEKLLLVRINNLDQGEGCFAGNIYLAKDLHRSPGRIANIISSLRKRGFVQNLSLAGNKRYIKLSVSLLVELHENVKGDPTSPLTKTLSVPSRKREPSLNENVSVYIKYKKDNSNELNTRLNGGGKNSRITNSKSQTEQTQMTSSANGIYSEPTPSVPKIFENIFIKTSIHSNPKKKMALPPKPLKKTSVETPVTREEIKLVDRDQLDIFEFYKANIFPTCNKKTKGLVEGIPRALRVFKQYFGDQGKTKLMLALETFAIKMRKSDWWKQRFDDSTAIFILAPSNFFSLTSIENKLLALTNNKFSDEQPNRHLVKTSTTEEERRERQAINQKSIDYLMSLGDNNPK